MQVKFGLIQSEGSHTHGSGCWPDLCVVAVPFRQRRRAARVNHVDNRITVEPVAEFPAEDVDDMCRGGGTDDRG